MPHSYDDSGMEGIALENPKKKDDPAHKMRKVLADVLKGMGPFKPTMLQEDDTKFSKPQNMMKIPGEGLQITQIEVTGGKPRKALNYG